MWILSVLLIDKNAALQCKTVCKVFLRSSNRAIVIFYIEYDIEYLEEYYMTKY